MMLWDIIRDWFVIYIFGGSASNNSNYAGKIGALLKSTGGREQVYSNTLYLPNNFLSSEQFSFSGITLGDWLSTTSTIIVLCLLCAFLIMCVIWLFKFFGGLFKW